MLPVLPAAVVLRQGGAPGSLSGGQEAFFEGHEHAFRVLGGVPAGKIRYDNLKAAVAQVKVESIGELNAMIDRWDAGDEVRRIGSRARTVAEFLAIERPLLRALPEEPSETGLWLTPRVDRFACPAGAAPAWTWTTT